VTLFVHLTKATRAEKIRRNGINRLRCVDGESPRGIFAVPVTRNFYISHQWLRELKRGSSGPIVGVYFRVPDDARVFVGHYGQSHRWMSADEAAAEFMTSEVREGWEVLIPTRIEPGQIHRIREFHRSSVGGIRLMRREGGRARARTVSEKSTGGRKSVSALRTNDGHARRLFEVG
jgi:hypothetical protein